MGKEPYKECGACIAKSRCSRYKRYQKGDYYQIPSWCKAQHNLYHAIEKAHIPEEFKDAWWENFQKYDDNEEVYDYMCDVYAKEDLVGFIDSGEKNLYLYSPKWGNGKTYAGITLLHEYILKSVLIPNKYDFETPLAMFVEFPDLIDRIRKAQFKEDETLEEHLEFIRECPLVLFDDVGATKITDYVHDQAYLLFNARYRNKKMTIVTSNLTPTALPDAIGGATASRILKKAGKLQFKGKDRRK